MVRAVLFCLLGLFLSACFAAPEGERVRRHDAYGPCCGGGIGGGYGGGRVPGALGGIGGIPVGGGSQSFSKSSSSSSSVSGSGGGGVIG